MQQRIRRIARSATRLSLTPIEGFSKGQYRTELQQSLIATKMLRYALIQLHHTPCRCHAPQL